MAFKKSEKPAKAEAAAPGRDLKELFTRLQSKTSLFCEYDDYKKELLARIKNGEKDLVIPDFATFGDSMPKMFIPTGIISFDVCTNGGFPCGRIAEVFGDESTCKTSLGMLAMDNCARMEGAIIYNDAEKTCDNTKFTAWKEAPVYVKESNNSLDEWWDYIHTAVKDLARYENLPAVIFWDSLPATVTESLLAADVGDKAYGGHGGALMNSDQLPKIGPAIQKALAALIVINQNRDNVGGDATKGDAKTKTPGGKAWKFWASLRIEMSRPKIGEHKDFYWDPEAQKSPATRKPSPEGFWVSAFVMKNKVGTERISCLFPVVTITGGEPNDTGPDPSASMWLTLHQAGLVTSAGSYWNLKGYPKAFYRKDFRTIFIELYPHCLDLIADPANGLGKNGQGFRYSDRARAACLAQMEFKYGHNRAEAKKILKLDKAD